MSGAWRWWLIAHVWDPLIFLLVFLLVFFTISTALQNQDKPGSLLFFLIGFFAAFFYGLALFLAWTSISDKDYPRYLALKARKQTGFQGWWYWKFRHRLGAYLTRTFRGPKGEVFVKMQVMREATSHGQEIRPEETPGLSELLRGFSERGSEIAFLIDEDRQPKEMKADADSFTKIVESSKTPAEAYIRYLTTVLLSFGPPERALLRLSSEGGLWVWLERYETRSWLFRFLVAAIVVALLYAIFREIVIPFI